VVETKGGELEVNKPKAVPFFPAAYLIMTLTSLAALVAVSWLGASLIDYWLQGTKGILADLSLIYWLAALVVVLPVHFWSYNIVRRTDRSKITSFSLRVAHGLLGMYLLATVGTAIALGAWLLAVWLNVAVGTGDVDTQLWVTTVSLLQAIGWSLYATVHYVRVRNDQSKPKYYFMTMGGLSTILLVLCLVFPIPAYRDVARDFVKETDLWKLQQAIGEYVDEHGNLPTKLQDLSDHDKASVKHLGDYQYQVKGATHLGLFSYELCATFAKSKGEGRDTGFGYASHSAGKQCFARVTISGQKLEQGLMEYVQNIENGAVKLQQIIRNFLAGAKQTVDQEIENVESFASGQVEQLETHLEGLEGGTVELQKEMQRLETNLGALEGNTGSLNQDFDDVEKFFHDLLCSIGLCATP